MQQTVVLLLLYRSIKVKCASLRLRTDDPGGQCANHHGVVEMRRALEVLTWVFRDLEFVACKWKTIICMFRVS